MAISSPGSISRTNDAPDDVQRRGLAGHHPAAVQPAEHQRAEALRVARRVQGPLVHEDQRVRAADQRQRGQRPGLDALGRAPPAGSRLGRRRLNSAVSTSVSDVAPARPPVACPPSPRRRLDQRGEFQGVDQVAVVAERQARPTASRGTSAGRSATPTTRSWSTGSARPRCGRAAC